MSNELQVILVDDHQIILDGISEILQGIEGVQMLEMFKDGKEALGYIVDQQVDLIITDLEMPGMPGDELMTLAKKQKPNLKVLVLTMHEEKSIVTHLYKAGADGYVLKSSGKEKLTKAIEELRQGNKFFSENVLSIMMSEDKEVSQKHYHPNLNQLTTREKEILVLTAEGHSSKVIGEKLFISNRTVDTHRTNMMKKLEVNNIAGLVRIAFKSDLL